VLQYKGYAYYFRLHRIWIFGVTVAMAVAVLATTAAVVRTEPDELAISVYN